MKSLEVRPGCADLALTPLLNWILTLIETQPHSLKARTLSDGNESIIWYENRGPFALHSSKIKEDFSDTQ